MSRTASESLSRLLSIVPWVAAQDGVAIDEICTRFDVTREQLLADLETVFLVGIHPFTPDELIEVRIDDDRVWINYADYFRRPLRLTAEQALGLLAASASMLEITGADRDGPLARGLDKLAGAVGVAPSALDVELGRAEDATLATLRGAVADRQRIEIDYYSFGRDERTTRRVDPWSIYSDNSAWYLNGWCHLAEGERLFRLDRMLRVELLAEHFDAPESPPTGPDLSERTELPRIELELARPAHWVTTQYPTDRAERLDDDRVRVRLPVAEPRWLERLLVRLGPHATVVEADPRIDAGAAQTAARRILDRYRA